jgi:hypothetical protein
MADAVVHSRHLVARTGAGHPLVGVDDIAAER